MVESPTKLKKNAKGLLKLLEKHNVTLDENGDPDLKDVQNSHVKKLLLKNIKLVRVTLMQADMEFEYPQKLEKIMIKSNILQWLKDEEEKIIALAKQAQQDRTAISQYNDLTPGDQWYLTVEDYYGFKMKDGTMGAIGGSESGADNKISFEQFMETRASQNIFDNDVSFLNC